MSSTAPNGSQKRPSHDIGGETGRVHSADFSGDTTMESGETKGSSSFRNDAEMAKEKVRDGATSAARDMKARATSFADEQKQYGAERLEGVAGVVDKAAADLEQELPQAAGYVREAAKGLNDFSRNLRDRSVGDIIDTVNDFARREPAAFFGTSVLAGFVLSRFLKSTSNRPIQEQSRTSRTDNSEDRAGLQTDVSTFDSRGSWPEMEDAGTATASVSEASSERPFDSSYGASSGNATGTGINPLRDSAVDVSPTEPGMGYREPGSYRQ